MKKYRFPTLTEILKVKVGTKYVWEDRVRQQSMLVHILEEIYDVKLNLQAFSFYPNMAYLGMPLSVDSTYREQAKPLWGEIKGVLEKNHWITYEADEYINFKKKQHTAKKAFEEIGYSKLLLSELVWMDFNLPSHGVGRQIELSLLQPLIGFASRPVSGMVLKRPGSLVLKYKSETELLSLVDEISNREGFETEPFYIRKCAKHQLKSVYKGKQCLNCYFKKKLI